MQDFVFVVKIISGIIIAHPGGIIECVLAILLPALQKVPAQISKADKVNPLRPSVEKIQNCQKAGGYVSKACNLLGNEDFRSAYPKILIYYYDFLSGF